MMYRHLLNAVYWVMSFCCLHIPAVNSAEVSAAVASNFMLPMQAIKTGFEKKTGHKIRLSYGSSGKFYAQIKNGAPFDVFLSADQSKPKTLIKDGLALADKNFHFTYAMGTLALWSAKPGLVDQQYDILKNASFNKLALPNPKLAPYGLAAIETLKNLGMYTSIAPQLVFGENISQSFQFISTGNAEVGFVALSQIMHEGKLKQGSAWIVPANLHQPIRQDAVLLSKAGDNRAAKALLNYLRDKNTQQIIQSYGYSTELSALSLQQ